MKAKYSIIISLTSILAGFIPLSFDKKIDKAYLDGRYGGVPIFNNIFPMELIDDENK